MTARNIIRNHTDKSNMPDHIDKENEHSINQLQSNISKRKLDTLDSFQQLKKFRSEMPTLLAAKDEAYAKLLAQYKELKQSNDQADQAVYQSIKQTLSTERQAQDKLKQEHAIEIAALEAKLQASQAQTATVERDLQSIKSINEFYLLLTGCSITLRSDTLAVCKMVNSSEHRELEFKINAGDDVIEYQPRRIEMNGTKYPTDLKKPIKVRPNRTPNLTRYLLATLYKPGADAAGQEEH